MRSASKRAAEDKVPKDAVQNEKVSTAAAPALPTGDSFSNTAALEVLSKAYDYILSVELFNGIYKIEARSARNTLLKIAPNGYYDVLYHSIVSCLPSGEVNRFDALFSRKKLYANFCKDKSSVCGEFALKESSAVQPAEVPAPASPPPDEAFQWFSIQVIRAAPPVNGLVRCFFLIRAIQNSEDNGRLPKVLQAAQFQDDSQRERLRVQKLLDGSQVMFFEYQIAEDTLLLHRNPGNPDGEREIKGYLRQMMDRCDWTIFHGDIVAVQQLLKKGEGALEFRYRAEGAYNAPFLWHRMRCARLEENGKAIQIIGAISNINEEYLLREDTHRLSVQLSTLISAAFTYVAEIDLLKGTTVRITAAENGYEREAHVYTLQDYIMRDIENGIIHPESVDEYKKWLKAGYLASVTTNSHIYAAETRLKLPGKDEYGWYTENIACPDPNNPHYFIRMRRNVTELHEQRERYAEMQQQVLFAAYNQTVIDSLSSLVEFRDVESGEHVQRVRSIAKLLLESLRQTEKNSNLTQEYIHRICSAAAMHDVGKIAIPDAILNKPGRLTAEEFAIMKTHTTKGAAIIDRLNLTGSDELRACCRDIALHHHERYDGNGYPEKLAGDNISIAAQVVGLADVYDALVSKRCYKSSFTHEQALRMIQNNECGAFNPKLLAAFLKCADQCHKFYETDQPAAAALPLDGAKAEAN